MKELLCDWILSCVLTVAPVTPLPDLYYGTMLYDYYQQDYQQALLDTLIVERRGELGADPVRFELAKGSFAFADGMYALAEQTFAAVADGELTPLDQMRLSFHLAREHLRRQDWDGVERNIAQIDLGKNWLGHERIHPEVEFMRAELATVRGDYVAAQTAIDRIEPKASMRAYALFNLGVAMRSAGAVDQAAAVFTLLGTSDAYTDDALDVKQRALVALSLINRQRTQAASAESILGAMPAEGRYRDLALTSYGGLAMDNGDYELAARIWLTLKKDGYWTESSATAQLAFPMSLEHMASRELALTNYRAAEQNFENRLVSLQAIAAQAEDPVWVGGLLKVFAQPDDDSDATANNVLDEWRRTLGHTDWLEWLAAEDVHELLLQWRELHAMQDWLTLLPDELTTFDALAAEQRRRAATARDLVDSTSLRTRRDEAAVTLTALRQRIDLLHGAAPEKTAAWMLVLADANETKLLDDLAAKRALLSQTPDDAARQRLLARIDHLEGLVFWNLVEARPSRIRAAEKEANDIAGVLTGIDSTLARIGHAEGVIAAGVATDFLEFQTRADAITAQIGRAITDRETRLAEQIRGGIRGEMAQVERQLLVTRIAIARATDQFAMDSAAGDAP
jgi:hypothetical protein